MLTTIRVLRVLVGLIAVWQVIGLLPVITNWLPNLQNVTGGMWAVAFVKVLVMLLCGGIYYWLGTIKNRLDKSESGTSEGRIIIFAVLALLAVGIVLAIAIPALSDRGSEAMSAATEADPWSQHQSPSHQTAQDMLPPPSELVLDEPQAAVSAITTQQIESQATPSAPPSPATTDQRFQRASVGVDYTNEQNSKCWERHQADLAKIPADVPLGEYAQRHESAQKRLDSCVTPR